MQTRKIIVHNRQSVYGGMPEIVGYFGVRHRFAKYTEWIYCRELFQRAWRAFRKGFFLHIHPNQGYDVERFVHTIETTLGFRKFSKFYPTQLDDVIYIEPLFFWRHGIRISFFTMMLRSAKDYHGGDPWPSFWAEKYVQETKVATERFLKGYTRYTGWDNQWVRQFRERKHVGRYLVEQWNILPIRLLLRPLPKRYSNLVKKMIRLVIGADRCR